MNDYSKLNIYLDTIKNKRLLLFLTTHEEVETLFELIDNFSKNFPECEFLVKEKLDLQRSNVAFIDELCKDVDQILYISNYAQIIIGKNSEVFSFLQAAHQSNDNKKRFISYDIDPDTQIKEQIETLIKPRGIIGWTNPQMNTSIRYKFKKYDEIKEIYSSGYQELFVLSLSKKTTKKKTYLEIINTDAVYSNATYTLSKNLGWTGVSVGSDTACYENWKNFRPTDKVIFCDVSRVDYKKLLNENYKDTIVDYLNIDVNEHHNVEHIIKILPHDRYKFSILTVKIFGYDKTTKNAIRNFLSNLGYTLIVHDAMMPWVYGDGVIVDDWWVDLNLVDFESALDMKNRAQHTRHPVHLLFK